MLPPQLYRLCVKSGNFQETPSFRILIGNSSKQLNPYFIPSDKQRYNCDTILERHKSDPYLSLNCYIANQLIGSGKLLFDSARPEMPNQKIDIKDSKGQSIAQVECSLVKIEKVVQVPALKITVLYGSFEEPDAKTHPYLVLKYGELNYQTKSFAVQANSITWNENFHCPESEMERILVESWAQVNQHQKFLGVSIISLRNGLNIEHQYDVQLLNKKKGKLSIGVYEDKHSKKEADYSKAPLRPIRVTVVEAIMKSSLKKGGFIRLHLAGEEYDTMAIFSDKKELRWNQAFNVKVNSQREQLTVKLCVREDMEEESGRATLEISRVSNRRYELAILDTSEGEIGKVYLQFYDQNLDIKEEIVRKGISVQLASRVMANMSAVQKRYAPKEALHQYMQQVQTVLQLGLLEVGKQRPANPIRALGEYLLNYRK